METNSDSENKSWRNLPRKVYVLMATIVILVVAIGVILSVTGLIFAPSTTTFSILSGSQVAKPGNYIYFTFNLGGRYLSNYLIGNFTSVGSGGDNGIRMILFNESNFNTFQSTGIAVGVLYETGLASSSSLNVSLPQTNTEYVVVFDNSMDSANSKTISGMMFVVSTNPS